MGHGMVLGLLKGGHQVFIVAHNNRKPIDDLVSQGASEVADLRAIAQNSQIIFLCLSNSRAVAEVVAGLKPHLAAGQAVIDTGTSEPQSSRQMAAELASHGVAFADAPLTGGPEQAEKSELGVLCGADTQTFERIRPLLACFATTIRHMGPVGSGHVAKLMSNYLVTGMIALVAEVFTAAQDAGLDWRSLYEAMLNGSGNSGVLRKMVEPALDGNFDGYRFSLDNACKDIGYYRNLETESEMVRAVAGVFLNAVAKGQGPLNVSHLLKPSR
jgi:3-hydroxyisobutyrate dehydrogenase-like beta-hydroxyacid dehydrogenase